MGLDRIAPAKPRFPDQHRYCKYHPDTLRMPVFLVTSTLKASFRVSETKNPDTFLYRDGA